MLKKLHFDIGDMTLALTIWLCSLPIIGFVAIPLFGLRSAATIALAAFFVMMAICWGICGTQALKRYLHK
ncbi:MAG TPA: hypothetical protein DCP32_10410 [Anaerolineaceae bacterium]|nr:MAG: hypothetical protein A2X24_00035 [Chloroflexi bacterium GWB2_54_36]HAL17133.1 hypothetical protein [Anaerolineaceae bacterium]HBA91305.1 hypothetical protein [Anaerolineaceae bacterium]